MKNNLIVFFIFISSFTFSQDSIWKKAPQLNFSLFTDVFYCYDFARPKEGNRQEFLYNHNRHNEWNLNVGAIGFNLLHDKYEVLLSFQAGTYVLDNYKNENEVIKHVAESYISIHPDKKNDFTLMAGIFQSHLGFEGIYSIENPTMTRTLLAENIPYYLTGIQGIYQPSKSLKVLLFSGNGWQRIARLSGNSLPAFGTQIQYLGKKGYTYNWSTFICSEYPDEIRRMRYFNNFFIQKKFRKVLLISDFDFGLEQRQMGSKNLNFWYSSGVIAKIKLNKMWSISCREEFYSDRNNVIISGSSHFQVLSSSIGLNYQLTQNLKFQIEGRHLVSFDAYRLKNDYKQNFTLGASLIASFKKNVK